MASHFCLAAACNHKLGKHIGPDSQGLQERIAQDFLTECSAGQGLHGEDGDGLALRCIAQAVAKTVEHALALYVGHHHDAFHLLNSEHGRQDIEQEIVLRRDVLNGVGVDHEFAQRSAEGLFVELCVVVGRQEVMHLCALLLMDEHHLSLLPFAIVRGAKTAIEGYALCPTGQIGGWDASAEHTLEVHDQVECHLVDVVGIGDYHVLAPGARLSVVVLFHLLILFFSGTKLQLFSEQRQQTAFLRKKRFPFV